MNAQKIIKRRVFVVFPILIICLSSCVSTNKYNQLVNQINELSARPQVDYTDSDGDGVIDMLDQEKNTPLGAPVDTKGIQLDSDGDGVPDFEDYEPFSPPGYSIDVSGVSQVPNLEILTKEDVKKLIDSQTRVLAISGGNDYNPMDHLEFKEFNLPPPPSSKRKTFDIIDVFGFPPNFATIDSLLADMLKKEGYYNDIQNQPRFSYYQIKTEQGKFKGFAIITEMEQIRESGSPVQSRVRFSKEVVMKDYPWYVVFPPLAKGYFRSFAFLITDDYYGSSTGEQLSMNSFSHAYGPGVGASSLHPMIASAPLSMSSKLHILVYEYEKQEGQSEGIYNPKALEHLNASMHLKKAKLLKYLTP